MAISLSHWVFLGTVIAIILTMVLQRSVVVVAIFGVIVLAMMSPNAAPGVLGHITFAAESVFRSILLAGIDLFDIMLLVAIMLAMLKAMSAQGADEMMIAPMRKLIVGPWSGFLVLTGTAYICAVFFWPSPATALVGTVLIPVALRAGLPAVGAAAAVNIAAHGMALSADPVIQAATRISANAAHIEPSLVLLYTLVFSLVVGIVALLGTAFLLRRELKTQGQDAVTNSGIASPVRITGDAHACGFQGRYCHALAILTPVLLFSVGGLIVYRAIYTPEQAIYGGAATALLGGTAIFILILASIAHDGHRAMESVVRHITDGFLFAMKVFGPVLPIVAFFFLGDPEHAIKVLGPGTPGFLLDFGKATGGYLGADNPLLPIGFMIVGILSGIDGFGFSGLPLTGSIAAALAGSSPHAVAILASIGQIGSIWVGGGTMVPWSGVCVAAALADVPPDRLARHNFFPVAMGFVAAAIVAMVLIVSV